MVRLNSEISNPDNLFALEIFYKPKLVFERVDQCNFIFLKILVEFPGIFKIKIGISEYDCVGNVNIRRCDEAKSYHMTRIKCV